MNKNIETQKIKVNNGQELINKAKEYKKSGGEWKLREKYVDFPIKEEETSIDEYKRLGWGIRIGNGEQEVDIRSTKNNINPDGVNDEINVRGELEKLFPEAKNAPFKSNSTGTARKLEYYTYKRIKEKNKKYDLYRYLVAENSWHLKKILNQYIRENESKVYQSANPHFSGWVEIIDGQDGNIYLYLGEKNESGGREIKIGIEKNEYENIKGSKSGNPREALENYWNLSTTDRPETPIEKEEYYKRLEENFQEQWPRREKLCRKYWERMCERMEECFNYWYEKSRQNQHWDHEANEKGILAKTRIAEIKEELSKNTNIKTCCDNDCPHSLSKSDYPTPTLPKSNKKNNQLKDNEKSQILQYFIIKNITKISLDNGKLIIEYNNNTKKTIESEDRELKSYHQIIQKLPNQSLSLTELQKNNTNNPSTPNKNNTGIYVGLVVGAFILGGIFVYFLVHKRKNK